MSQHDYYRIRPDGTIEAPDGSVIVTDLASALEVAKELRTGWKPQAAPQQALPASAELVIPGLHDLGEGPRSVLQALANAAQEKAGAGIPTRSLAVIASVRTPSGLAATSRAIKKAVRARIPADDRLAVEDVFWSGTTALGRGWFVSPEQLVRLGLAVLRTEAPEGEEDQK